MCQQKFAYSQYFQASVAVQNNTVVKSIRKHYNITSFYKRRVNTTVVMDYFSCGFDDLALDFIELLTRRIQNCYDIRCFNSVKMTHSHTTPTLDLVLSHGVEERDNIYNVHNVYIILLTISDLFIRI